MDELYEFDRNDYHRKYRDANRSRLNEYMRDYRKAHPKKKKECECGSSVRENTIFIHQQTEKHKRLLKAKNES